mmetsp:Transcript_17353/g.28011  ORF Transcript_17353/g.28011 Transcript_17353/m.28011 type:complete len:80 (-) Transcript_17353:706-945(-)
MVFVYQGAGKKQKDKSDPCLNNRRCQRLACDIQWCLSRNGYQQAKCVDFVNRWEECCRLVKEKVAAEEAASSVQEKSSK